MADQLPVPQPGAHYLRPECRLFEDAIRAAGSGMVPELPGDLEWLPLFLQGRDALTRSRRGVVNGSTIQYTHLALAKATHPLDRLFLLIQVLLGDRLFTQSIDARRVDEAMELFASCTKPAAGERISLDDAAEICVTLVMLPLDLERMRQLITAFAYRYRRELRGHEVSFRAAYLLLLLLGGMTPLPALVPLDWLEANCPGFFRIGSQCSSQWKRKFLSTVSSSECQVALRELGVPPFELQ
ncbi:MAG: hypothetical protein KF858_02370 [Candidatus Sumerlaeia bacterium]|nr:hypothetical protein [Candidatus Sumerlaeia bacterium]